jgi:hypothetical protein
MTQSLWSAVGALRAATQARRCRLMQLSTRAPCQQAIESAGKFLDSIDWQDPVGSWPSRGANALATRTLIHAAEDTPADLEEDSGRGELLEPAVLEFLNVLCDNPGLLSSCVPGGWGVVSAPQRVAANSLRHTEPKSMTERRRQHAKWGGLRQRRARRRNGGVTRVPQGGTAPLGPLVAPALPTLSVRDDRDAVLEVGAYGARAAERAFLLFAVLTRASGARNGAPLRSRAPDARGYVCVCVLA